MGLFGLFFSEDEIKHACSIGDEAFFNFLDLLVSWKNKKNVKTGEFEYCPFDIIAIHSYWKRTTYHWELVVYGVFGDNSRDVEAACLSTHPIDLAFFKKVEDEMFKIGDPYNGTSVSGNTIGICMYPIVVVNLEKPSLSQKAKKYVADYLNERIRRRYPNERIIIPE